MSRLAPPILDQDHLRGPLGALVTLVEYGDFECPYCGQAHYVVEALQDELGPQLRLVYRHFPLARVHPHSEAAAQASEAAGAQGKFWEMHDTLFENQHALEEDDLLEYARSLELDLTEFEQAMRSGRFLPRVKDDLLSGDRMGMNGTPTFFINEAQYVGSFAFPEFYRAIRHAAAVKTDR